MTLQEMHEDDYNKIISLSSFLFDEYKNKTSLLDIESLNNMLHDHDLHVTVSDLSTSDSIFVIEKFGEWYTITVDQQLNDITYLKFIYSFIISYISLNSNLIFHHYNQNEFENIVFKHGDTFDSHYDAYIMACIMIVPPFDKLSEIIKANMNKQNNTVDLTPISNALNVDIDILRKAASFYGLITI